MKLLGQVPCASSGTLLVDHNRDGKIINASCAVCDGVPSVMSNESEYDHSDAQEAIAAFTNIIELPVFEQSRRPRVLGMIALRSLALHFKTDDLLNLEKSLPGQWCLRSLRSSMRELRVTAGYVIIFLIYTICLLTLR